MVKEFMKRAKKVLIISKHNSIDSLIGLGTSLMTRSLRWSVASVGFLVGRSFCHNFLVVSSYTLILLSGHPVRSPFLINHALSLSLSL